MRRSTAGRAVPERSVLEAIAPPSSAVARAATTCLGQCAQDARDPSRVQPPTGSPGCCARSSGRRGPGCGSSGRSSSPRSSMAPQAPPMRAAAPRGTASPGARQEPHPRRRAERPCRARTLRAPPCEARRVVWSSAAERSPNVLRRGGCAYLAPAVDRRTVHSPKRQRSFHGTFTGSRNNSAAATPSRGGPTSRKIDEKTRKSRKITIF